MAKKLLITALFLIICLFASSPVLAYQQENYANPIRVEIQKGSTITLNLNGVYKLTSSSTNEQFYLSSTAPVQFSIGGAGVQISHAGNTITSSTGFNINAVRGTEDFVVFKTAVDGRKGATSNYEVKKSYKALQGAQFVTQFTNASGELWYSILDEAGVASWVPASATIKDKFTNLPLGTTSKGKYRGSFDVLVSGTSVQLVNRLDIEDYLKGVVPSEMPASWHAEALKAQAITARSYAIRSRGILSSSTSSQVYKGYSGEVNSTNKAINDTRGKVIYYNGRVVQTYFYSTSGGRTANVGDVWNSNQADFPYLISVDDSVEVSPYSQWTDTIPASNILTAFGFNPSTDLLIDLKIIKTGANGEVGAVTVTTTAGEKTIKGNELVIRGLFKNSSNQLLKSNWFDVKLTNSSGVNDLYIQYISSQQKAVSLLGMQVQTTSGIQTISDNNVMVQTKEGIVSTSAASGISSITVNGKGYGHRIGMSQYGAKARAEDGANAEAILKHYYPGTTIGVIN